MTTKGFHSYPRADSLAATRIHRGRLERLEEGVAAACEPFIAAHRTALALSFGKDSMTILHVLHMAGLLGRCAVVMWNGSGIETPDTLEMRDYVVERYRIDNYVETWPDAGTVERTLRLIDLTRRNPIADFVYECLEKPRWKAMDEHEINGTILGLRAAESKGRSVHVALRGTEYWNRREKADILLPLARWSTDDIFMYAALRSVPLHPIYHRMAEIGFNRRRVRHSTPADLIARNYGQVAALKRLYPETFRRYADIAPIVRTFT